MIKLLGKQITAARDLLEITQKELAEACELNQNTLSRFEAGTGQPHRGNLRKIVRELSRRGIEFSNGTGIGVRLDYKKAAEFAAGRAVTPASETLPEDDDAESDA
jgi:transcriptional regulator with XRE-family HTH domain